MALPVLESNRYKCKLPVSKIEVEYRPFLVKEQKFLLTALESEETQQVNNSVLDLIKSCLFTELDANSLPIADVEYLFLQLRIKSVGETSDIQIPCSNCEELNPLTIELENVNLANEELPNSEIKLREDIVVNLQHPSLKDVPVGIMKQEDMKVDDIFGMIRNCVSSVTYKDEVMTKDDFSDSELQDFLEQFTNDEFEKLQNFLVEAPRLVYPLSFTCKKCEHVNEKELVGIQDFFG